MAKIEVRNAPLGQRRLERLFVEVRHPARDRPRADIGDCGYARTFDERDELRQRMIGVANRENARLNHLRASCRTAWSLAHLSFFGHIEAVPSRFHMRALILVLSLIVVAARVPVPSMATNAQACTDDYMTVDTFIGTILEILPAPEPFV